MPRAHIEWIGSRYGRLVVVSLSGTKRSKKIFNCRCDCGNTSTAYDYNLRNGHTRSCGCLHSEATTLAKTVHGLSKKSEFDIWVNMRQRCSNPNNPAYDRYGGRGIKVHPEWDADFTAFFAYIGERPSPIHSIDRIDNNRGYEPGNIQWALPVQQALNRRPFTLNGALVPFEGREMTIHAISREIGVPSTTLYKRQATGRDLRTGQR